jgi:hypothetical protein
MVALCHSSILHFLIQVSVVFNMYLFLYLFLWFMYFSVRTTHLVQLFLLHFYLYREGCFDVDFVGSTPEPPLQ